MLAGLPYVPDDQLERLSRENPGWRFERDDDGALLVSPTYTDSGSRSAEAVGQLRDWSKAHGGKVFDSSTGFRTPRGGVLSPDASWLSRERLEGLAPEERRRYWPICPDVVVEVASVTDDWRKVRAKLRTYMRAGARYAVAINSFTREVYALGDPPSGLVLDSDAIIAA